MPSKCDLQSAGCRYKYRHRQIRAVKHTEIPFESSSGEHCMINTNREQATGDTEVGLVEVQMMLSLSILVITFP